MRVLSCPDSLALRFESHRTVIAAVICLLAVNSSADNLCFDNLWSDSQDSGKVDHRGCDHISLSRHLFPSQWLGIVCVIKDGLPTWKAERMFKIIMYKLLEHIKSIVELEEADLRLVVLPRSLDLVNRPSRTHHSA